MIVFSVIYALFLCAYFVTRVGDNIKHRAINKIILATMYLVYAIVMFHVGGFSGYHYVMMAALFLAYMGDLFLIFDLNRGGDFFLAGNVCFATFYLASLKAANVPFVNYFWVFIIWAILISLFIYLAKKYPNVLKLGKMKYPMALYLSSITLHGLLGLVSAIFIGTTPFIVMGIGSVSFMISDYILTLDRFVIPKRKWLIRCNSLTYFVGLLLIVLSLGL
jgi:uncharacterized membrane protein YhhN